MLQLRRTKLALLVKPMTSIHARVSGVSVFGGPSWSQRLESRSLRKVQRFKLFGSGSLVSRLTSQIVSVPSEDMRTGGLEAQRLCERSAEHS